MESLSVILDNPPIKKLFKNEIWLPFAHSGHDGVVAPSGRLVHPLLDASKEGDDDGTITV